MYISKMYFLPMLLNVEIYINDTPQRSAPHQALTSGSLPSFRTNLHTKKIVLTGTNFLLTKSHIWKKSHLNHHSPKNTSPRCKWVEHTQDGHKHTSTTSCGLLKHLGWRTGKCGALL